MGRRPGVETPTNAPPVHIRMNSIPALAIDRKTYCRRFDAAPTAMGAAFDPPPRRSILAIRARFCEGGKVGESTESPLPGLVAATKLVP